MNHLRLAVLSLAPLLLLMPSDALAAPIYGIDLNGVLYRVDKATGAAENPVPTGNLGTVGLTFSSSGTLYSLNTFGGTPPNSLIEIDRITGATTVIPTSGLTEVFEGGLAFDPDTGLLFGAMDTDIGAGSDGYLITLDPDTGVAERISTLAALDVSAVAFDPAGELWVLDNSNLQCCIDARLLRLDKANGAILETVVLDTFLGAAAGMAFDPDTGELFVAEGGTAGGGTVYNLYTVNFTTATLDVVGAIGTTFGLMGLSFLPVPEPNTAVLVGIGLVILATRRRQRR